MVCFSLLTLFLLFHCCLPSVQRSYNVGVNYTEVVKESVTVKVSLDPGRVVSRDTHSWRVSLQKTGVADGCVHSWDNITEVGVFLPGYFRSLRLPRLHTWVADQGREEELDSTADSTGGLQKARLIGRETLCLPADDDELTIIFTSYSHRNETIQFKVDLVPRWVVNPYQKSTLNLSAVEPAILHYTIPETAPHSLLLNISSMPSSPCMCSLVSIQDARGRIHHTVEEIKRFSGIQSNQWGPSYYSFWQTMLDNVTVVIETARYPQGFAVVIVASPTDHLCQVKQEKNRCPQSNCSLPTQELILQLENNSSYEDYIWVTFGTMGAYCLVFVLSIGVSYIEFTYFYGKYEDLEKMQMEKLKTEQSLLENLTMRAMQWLGNTFVPESNDNTTETGDEKKEKLLINVTEMLRQYSGNGDENNEVLEMDDILEDLNKFQLFGGNNDGYKCRLKKDLTVADISCKLYDATKSKSMYQKTDMYWQAVFVISIYYSIPTLQMVVDKNHEYDTSGNQDLCYFNFPCTKPLGSLKDFGGLFSNLGYAVLGILFTCIVRLKSKRFSTMQEDNEGFDPHLHGVPMQTGIYYAMGAALVMEGFMSTVYHVCPTTLVFQFDTTYMYLIAILMFVRLFQGRHPDVSLNAFEAYMGLGIALILEALSFYFNGLPYWIVFCVIYFSFMMIIAVICYSLGAVKFDRMILLSVTKVVFVEVKGVVQSLIGRRACSAPVFRARIVLLFVMFIANLSLCLSFALYNAKYASNNLLALFMGNLFIYVVYYVIMKIYCGEKLTWSCTMYGVLLHITTFPSLYFFFYAERNSDLSPAESRHLNHPCSFLNFYDYHDIWHFLGGFGLFFTYMFLLTIDEDVKYKRRDQLHVF